MAMPGRRASGCGCPSSPRGGSAQVRRGAPSAAPQRAPQVTEQVSTSFFVRPTTACDRWPLETRVSIHHGAERAIRDPSKVATQAHYVGTILATTNSASASLSARVDSKSSRDIHQLKTEVTLTASTALHLSRAD